MAGTLALAGGTAAADPAWTWDDQTPEVFPAVDATATVGGETYRVALVGDSLVVSASHWRTPVAKDLADGPYAIAAIAVDDQRVYVAIHNGAATGCTLVAYARATGAPLWSVVLEGDGPIAHSKYRNRVQLRLVDGDPVVFGYESAGLYIERRRADTGALVSTTRPQVPTPAVSSAAESLFYELTTQLARRTRYAVDVDDFVSRTDPRDHAGRAARVAKLTAIAHVLDRVELDHGKPHLHVELVGHEIRARKQ